MINDIRKNPLKENTESYYVRAISNYGYNYFCKIISSTGELKHIKIAFNKKLQNIDGEDWTCYNYKIYEFYKKGSSKIKKIQLK